MSRFPLVPMFYTLSSNFSVDLTGNLGYSLPTKRGGRFSALLHICRKKGSAGPFSHPLKLTF